MTPIAHARSILSRLKSEGVESILVNYSGGKDSLCVLDLCVSMFGSGNVVAVYMYIVPDLDCDQQRMRLVSRRFGARLLKLPHPDLASHFRRGYMRPADLKSGSNIRALKQKDIAAVSRSRTGVEWIASGERKLDSLFRRGMLSQTEGGLWRKNKRVFPIMEWKPRDVFSYLRARKLPIPFDDGKDELMGTNGLKVSTDSLRWLKARWPGDYQKFRDVFPHIDALLYRDEVNARRQIETAAPLPSSPAE